ncbi:hypothetical protein JIQ42_04468 [Leishmania sp. Namibia]|uniref:hypothetical protein n=1 Tax=Leishmania sp. Namibia TaxID=2802991 RepID=UPI001B61857A|nr:hypothetical protein JIQ42_04468 [Leishmania sp. Namibia]
MSSAAAAQLQRLLDGYVSASLEDCEKKLVPNGSRANARGSHALALDAAEVVGYLPFFLSALNAAGGSAASRRVQNLDAAQGFMAENGRITVPTADRTRASDALSSFILYLSDVVERHLHAFMSAVSVGPSFTTLRSAVELRHGNASGGSSNSERCARDCRASEHGHRGGGGPCVNFIAWVALEAYRLLARDAESRQRERRSAGGATSADAGVRTDAYVRWEREIGERVSAALAALQELRTTRSGWSDASWYHVLRAVSSAADAQLDGVFATHPHFFYLFMCTELLPDIQQRLHRCDEVNCYTLPLVRLRQALRSTATTVLNDDLQPTHLTPSLSTTFWGDAVSLLCCECASSASLGGAEMTGRNDGDFIPAVATPVQTSVFVAAAVASSLAVPLLRPACLWIDRFASLTSTVGAHSRSHVVPDERSRAQAVMHIMDVCMRSAQMVPFPMCDGCDADMPLSFGSCEVAGEWLIPSTSSPLQVRTMPFFGLRRQRRAVVLPGLAIAATRIHSLAAAYSGKASATDAAAPDASAPAGTCVWSPAGALGQATWTEALLSSAAVAPCCDDNSAPFTSVSAVPKSRLVPVELLLLFEDVPSDAAALARLRAAVDAEVREGWVLLAVQASVPKATQQCVEATWGTDTRPVILLSAVGRWGLQQLALRFDVQPNTSASDVCCLRGVRRRSCSNSGAGRPLERRGCGVAALPLRGQQYAPSSSLSANYGARHQQLAKGYSRRTRYAAAFVEVREHYLFVVGECTDVVGPDISNAFAGTKSERTAGAVADSAAAAVSPAPPAASQLQPSPPTLSPSAVSMFFRGDSESSSSETSNSSLPCTSSSGSTFSDTTMVAAIAAGGAGEGVMQAWYGDPAVPPIPFVVSSVLVGAATRGAQQELVYTIGYHWRLLLHQLVLPEPLCCRVPTSGERGATAMAIRKLDSLLQPPRLNGFVSASPSGAPKVYTPEQLRALAALRDALLSYELLSLQHGPEGRTLDESWRVLQKYRESSTNPDEGCVEAPTESWLAVQSAYLALADCLDELCLTVVLGVGGGGDASKSSGESRDSASRDLYFFPVI